MARHVHHVVDAPHDAVVAFRIGTRAVAGQVVLALKILGVIAFLEAFRVTPDRADHRRPRPLDHQDASLALAYGMTGLIDDVRDDSGERERRGAGFGGRCAGQRSDHVAAGLGLPPRVDDRAASAADGLVVPHPGFRVDRLADRAEDAQARQVVFLWQVASGFDQRADRSRCRVENRNFVVLDHFPETTRVGIGRHTLKYDFGRPYGERTIADIGVAGDPADVCRTPEHISRLVVEHPLHRQDRPQQIAAGGVLHPFGFAG